MSFDFDKITDRFESDCSKWHEYDPDVLPLWVADMDFAVPDAVTQALEARVAHAVFGYCRPPAELREVVLNVNHVVTQLYELVEAQQQLLLGLNHDVRAGSERALPLFLGYTERLRLDTDTAIGAAQVIERQLAILEDLVAANAPSDPT